MTEVNFAAKSAVLIILITLVSKVLGFTREIIIAAGFGASFYTDAYVVALTIPAVLFSSLSRSLQTTFIPIFNELLYKEEKKAAFIFANNAMNLVIIGTACLSALAFIFMPQITGIISPGFKGEAYSLTISLARIMIPAGMIWGILGITGGMLNSFKVFGPPAAAGIVYNVIIIGSVITLGHYWGIKGLALGTALGVAGELLIQIPWLKKIGVTWSCFLRLKDASLKKMGELMIPILASSVVVQLNVVIDRLLASKLPEGSIAALNFANRLNGFILGSFVFAFVTVIFPSLSQKAAAGDLENFKNLFFKGIKTVFFITCPAIVAILILKVPMIRLLFERGAFDAQDTMITATAFMFYGLGLAASGMREVINVAFYALQDTRTPMIGGICCLLLNIGLNLVLVGPMAHGGLALATSLAVSVYVVIMMIMLYQRLKWKNIKEIIAFLGKVLLASAGMGLAMKFAVIILGHQYGPSLLQQMIYLIGVSALGMTIFFGISLLLKIEEARMFMQTLRKYFKYMR